MGFLKGPVRKEIISKMDENTFKILDMVLSVVVPVGILILGWVYMAKEKKDNKIVHLEDQVDSVEMQELKNQLNTIEDLCKANSLSIDSLNRVVRELSSQQIQLAASNRINGQCTHALAKLVMVLAEGIRDNHLDGNITAAINDYKQFEHDILADAMIGGNIK